MEIRYTGIFASKEEVEDCVKLSKKASETPMLALSTEDALLGRDLATMAWQRAKEKCHEYALKHGLPEIDGFYGISHDGEFLEAK
jgi:hypothetical protein